MVDAPRDVEYAKMLQWIGWNVAIVITWYTSTGRALMKAYRVKRTLAPSAADALRTSVKSSMLSGLMSTMLNDWFSTFMFHRFTRRSSADTNVSQSELMEIELMWYECTLVNT